MRHTFLIASMFVQTFLLSQTKGDTLVFSDKKFVIEKDKQTAITNSHDFPFAIFKQEYKRTDASFTYLATEECNCKSSGLIIDSEGNPLSEKICTGSAKSTYTVYSFIDTIRIDLKKADEKIFIKTKNTTQIISMIQFKLVYENMTKTLNLDYSEQSFSRYFSSLDKEITENPGVKFIIVNEMFYKNKAGLVYSLPYSFLLRPK